MEAPGSERHLPITQPKVAEKRFFKLAGVTMSLRHMCVGFGDLFNNLRSSLATVEPRITAAPRRADLHMNILGASSDTAANNGG